MKITFLKNITSYRNILILKFQNFQPSFSLLNIPTLQEPYSFTTRFCKVGFIQKKMLFLTYIFLSPCQVAWPFHYFDVEI